jgi:hypothetical protein
MFQQLHPCKGMMALCVLLLTLHLIALETTEAKTQRPHGTLTIFVVEDDRPEAVLKADAERIAKCLFRAQSGDAIHVFTTSNQSILAFNLEEGLRRVEQKKHRLRAKGELIGAFKKMFEAKTDQNATVEIAESLSKAFDRLNFSRTYRRVVLVLMSNGLQRTAHIDWRDGVPSDSWCVDRNSPFASIAKNANETVPVDVIMLPMLSRYVDASHGELIKRWYALFFQIKKAQLIAFTYDHHAAEDLLLSGRLSSPILPKPPVDLEGQLSFTPYDPLQMQ